ncbi:MAG: competence/damage-inducible protein A [Elusimicrobiota bacterium]|nr:competence/damage-inducible protein A [Elusimicrobiota bacterium]
MQLEVVCIGTELLSNKVNTNIAYIGEKLNSIGLELNKATTIPDNLAEMIKTFKEVIHQAEIAFIVGGLGPTFDDLTRQAVAKALNKKLVFKRELMHNIAKHFIEKNIEMPKGNERQAYIIEGAVIIENKLGTAPGQIIEVKSKKLKVKTLFLLPGPPRELHAMFEQTVLPYLKSKYERKIVKSKMLHVYGLSESKVNELILPVVETERKLIGTYVSFNIISHRSIIDIQITVSGTDETLIDEILHNITRELYQILGENIYGEDNQTLESVVGELLIKSKKTLSVAESCTGGLVSNRITNIPESSLYFKQGVVTYSNQSKIDLLKVNPETIEKYGPVSEQTAIEMVRGVRKLANSDYAVSITGIAGPSGATKTLPLGTVFFGLITPERELTAHKQFSGTRTEIKEQAVNFILDALRRELILV